MLYTLRSFSRTHVGCVREENEDRVFAPSEVTLAGTSGVFALCDGMGGESHGALAAQITVDTVARHLKQLQESSDATLGDAVAACIRSANRIICQKRHEFSVTIGTTLSLVRIREGLLHAFNIGDSRIYLLRSGALRQISVDHTVLQSRINMGIATVGRDIKRFGSQLTQHLGIFEEEMTLQAHHARFKLSGGDTVLLCSDGLTDMVCDDAIRDILLAHPEAQGADLLIDAALRNGGTDNVSLILLHLV